MLKIFQKKFIISFAFIGASLCFATMQKPAKPEISINPKLFENPPAEFRVSPFYSWNDTLEPEEIREQLKFFKNAGWGGMFLHARDGLLTPYMGEGWFKAVDTAIEESRKLGMLVYLYDEDKWPSGTSGSRVPLADESFRQKVLLARGVGEKAPEQAIKFGEPMGDLQIYTMTMPLGSFGPNAATYADTMYDKAVKKFIEEAYEPYFKRYGKDYGTLIPAQFTDEPACVYAWASRGTIAYSTEIFAEFKKFHGYDAEPHLSKLFRDEENAEAFRLDWYDTTFKMFELNYTKQIADWCKAHGIAFTGHFLFENELVRQQSAGNRIMPNYRHMQIPGIDHLKRQIYERCTAKQVQSVAHQYGKPRIVTELYGAAGPSLNFEDRKWIALQQISLGANLLNTHMAMYSLAGLRKRDYPQHISYQQPWFKVNKYLDEPLARLCYAMSKGVYDAEGILLLHPHETAAALWKVKVEESNAGDSLYRNSATLDSVEKITQYEKAYQKINDVLIENRIGYDIGDELILDEDAYIKAGAIVVKNASYDTVILPAMFTIRTSTFQLLKEFKDAGGKIFKTPNAPTHIDGIKSDELIAWLDGIPEADFETLPKLVRDAKPAPLELKNIKSGNANLLWSHLRNLEDSTRIALVSNLDRFKNFEGEVIFKGGYSSAVKFDFSTGKVEQIYSKKIGEDLIVPLKVNIADAALILLQNTPNKILKQTKNLQISHQYLENWAVKRLEDNVLNLDYASFIELTPEGPRTCADLPVSEIQTYLNSKRYKGSLFLTYKFTAKDFSLNRKMRLVIEHPERCSLIRINGREITYDNLPYWKDVRWLPIDITGLVKDGENHIDLAYANFESANPQAAESGYAKHGTEIESLFIVGDFSVEGEFSAAKVSAEFKEFGVPEPKAHALKRSSIFLTDPKPLKMGDATLGGLPFYAGAIEYSKQILDFKAPAKSRIILSLEKLEACVAEVMVGDATVDILYGSKLSCDITDYLKNPREEIKIVLYPTLRNLLGPHHTIDADLAFVSPAHFSAKLNAPNHIKRFEVLQKWAAGDTPENWDDNYKLLAFGSVGKISITVLIEK